MLNMNKTSLIKSITKTSALSQKQVETIIDEFLLLIKQGVIEHNKLTFRRFGSFKIKKTKARKGRNFKTGETILIPESLTVNFNPSKLLEGYKPKSNERTDKEDTELVPSITTKIYTIRNGGSQISEFHLGSVDSSAKSGKRKKKKKTEFEYIESFLGKIGYTVTNKYNQTSEIWNYPIITMPKNEALVRESFKIPDGVKGICEPMFYEKLKNYLSDLRRNLLLPIKDKKYGYEPDLTYVDEKINLFIDIEIDEPYDGATRKPTHFHNSYDLDRNAYFNESGWVVIRFAEEQIFKYTLSCCKKVAEVIDVLTGSNLLDSFQDIPDLEAIKQWTYEEALEMERNLFRESYLGIEFEKEEAQEEIEIESYGDSEQEITDESLIIKKIDFEFFPELEEKKQRLSKLINQCIQFDYEDSHVKDIVLIKEVRQNRRQFFLYGYSLIENKDCRYDIRLIDDFTEKPNPILYQSKNQEEILKLLDFAVENFFAINILYQNNRQELNYRTVTELRYDFSKDGGTKYYLKYEHYLMSLLSDNKFVKEIVRGYCNLRKDERYFLISSITSITIIDIEYNKREIREALAIVHNNTGWLYLIDKKFDLALEFFQKASLYFPINKFILGNIAHAQLLLGNYEQAIKLYEKHKGQKLEESNNMLWEDMVKQDFKEFQEKGIYHDDFQKVLDILS